jgi:hypothetical protein
MEKETAIKIFEEKKVRTHWSEAEEKWYFSIIDVIEILTGSPRPRKYWNALKTKLKNEGSELSHNLGQLKMQAADRDNMTNTELILNMLAEASTKDISTAVNPKDFEESKSVAKQGGNVAKVARKELEARTGKKVVTSLNAKNVLELKETKQKKRK